jgi:hypothetical protein
LGGTWNWGEGAAGHKGEWCWRAARWRFLEDPSATSYLVITSSEKSIGKCQRNYIRFEGLAAARAVALCADARSLNSETRNARLISSLLIGVQLLRHATCRFPACACFAINMKYMRIPQLSTTSSSP